MLVAQDEEIFQHEDYSTLKPKDFLKIMMISRAMEIRENILFRQGRGQFHLPSAGHEAVSGLAPLIQKNDLIYCYYRDRALLLARGVPLSEMALGFFAKEESSSGGRQMASHFSYEPLNVVSCATPTAMQCLPAVGTAWGIKQKKSKDLVFCSIGEASTRQGEFFEALAFAIQESLPIVFVVHDNGYGISTPTENMNPVKLGMIPEKCLKIISGHCPKNVFTESKAAIKKVRKESAPVVLWIKLDRLMSHTSSDDQTLYRSKEELDSMFQRDPVELYKNELLEKKLITQKELLDFEADVPLLVKELYSNAEKAKDPSPLKIEEHKFSNKISFKRLENVSSMCPQKDKWSMAEAFNLTLDRLLSENNRTLLFGEDIKDPKGGVFGLTKKLSTKYPSRVFNAPLAEATIAGTASGLALQGFFPIFELQFIDFLGPAFNQVVNQIATLRWRSKGSFKCPLILYAPCGSYISGGGPWHSQTSESWLSHAPGLKVYMPSNANDAANMLYSAAYGDDPVIMLLPKNQFQKFSSIEDTMSLYPERAVIRKQGEHLTLISWGNSVEIAINAAKELEGYNIDAEVIDLRSLSPCDWSTIHSSVRKTGRAIVVQEDNQTCSFGQAIISELVSDKLTWESMYTPPQLVCRQDVHIGFSPVLEKAVLPHAKNVIDATKAILGDF